MGIRGLGHLCSCRSSEEGNAVGKTALPSRGEEHTAAQVDSPGGTAPSQVSAVRGWGSLPGGGRMEDGALLPPGGRAGGTAEEPGQRAREGASPTARPAGPPALPAVTGRGAGAGVGEGRTRCRLARAPLVLCPRPACHAATFLFSAGRGCHTATVHVFIENSTFWLFTPEEEKLRDRSGPLTSAGLPKSSKNWMYRTARTATLQAPHRSQLLNCTPVGRASV